MENRPDLDSSDMIRRSEHPSRWSASRTSKVNSNVNCMCHTVYGAFRCRNKRFAEIRDDIHVVCDQDLPEEVRSLVNRSSSIKGLLRGLYNGL